MKYLLPLVIMLIFGCGEREKRERTISQLNVLADTLTERFSKLTVAAIEDGVNLDLDQLDPWGHPIHAIITKGTLNYTLEVYSNGPDGLPKNHDDIVVIRTVRHDTNGVVEKTSRNIIRGMRQGWKE